MAILKYTDAEGNIVKVNSYKVNNIIVSNERGQSESDVMSQKAVSDSFESIEWDVNQIKNELGEVASEESVSELANIVSGKANKSDVYTKTESDGKYQPKGDYLTEHQSLAEYAKKSELYDDSEIDGRVSALEAIDHSQYLTQHQSLAEYAKKSDLYDDTALSGRVSTLEAIDHSKFLTQHQSLSDYAKKSELYDDTALDNRVKALEAIDHSAFLTEHQSLDNYYTKSEVDDLVSVIDCGEYE